jgi:hypothetical protein
MAALTQRVLGHLVGIIASTHIPTGASTICAADLLFSHFKAAPNAPALLGGFVNDTFVSMYPSEPRDKVASTRFICTATRVVHAGLVNELCEVVDTQQVCGSQTSTERSLQRNTYLTWVTYPVTYCVHQK